MMHSSRALALLALITSPALAAFPAGEPALYHVRHELAVKDVPATAKRVQVWFWLPREDARQEVRDLSIREAPQNTAVTHEARYGSAFLYADAPGGSIKLVTEFTLAVREVSVNPDPAKAGAITEAHRRMFAAELRRDVPHQEVTPGIEALAAKICGAETNPVKQARALYDHVVSTTRHYSRQGPPSSKQGDAGYCLAKGGGACTDMHALWSALARARGIPTRMHFGSRLQAKNEGTPHDPGYRCWVEYFAPGYGWIPMDLAAGNTDDAQRDFYASGLDARRVAWAEGRDLALPGAGDAPVNLVIGAHVLVDGQPWDKVERTLTFKTAR